MQLELFGRTRPNARAAVVDWHGVSGLDLATDLELLRRYLREEAPRKQAEMKRWARAISERRRAAWRAERGR